MAARADCTQPWQPQYRHYTSCRVRPRVRGRENVSDAKLTLLNYASPPSLVSRHAVPTSTSKLATRAAQAWIEHVAQSIADEVERQHDQGDRDPRRERHPGLVTHRAAEVGAQHRAEAGVGRRDAEPKERGRRLDQDRRSHH